MGDKTMVYDASDRHIATTTHPSSQTITYRRDPLDRIVERERTIGFRSASSAANGLDLSSTLTIPKPTGVVAGDVMIMHLTIPGGVPDIAVPTGWTLIRRENILALQSAAFWRAAGPSEPGSYTVDLPLPLPASGGITAYTGVQPFVPIWHTTGTTGVGQQVTINSTSTLASGRVVGLYGFELGGATPPPEQTQRWNQTSPGPIEVSSVASDEYVGTGTSLPPRTASSSSIGAWTAIAVSLQPVASPAVVRYGYAGHDDNITYHTDRASVIKRRHHRLLGGVTVGRTSTFPFTGDDWSYPNLHGDVAAEGGGVGNKTGPTIPYDPFGQRLTVFPPNNTDTRLVYGWVGSAGKLTETEHGIDTVQMGARQYVPGLGRFLSVDPIEGGCANDYVYVFGDPVNQKDLSGRGPLDFIRCNALGAAGVLLAVAGVALAATGAVGTAPIGLALIGGLLSAQALGDAIDRGDRGGTVLGATGVLLGLAGAGAGEVLKSGATGLTKAIVSRVANTAAVSGVFVSVTSLVVQRENC